MKCEDVRELLLDHQRGRLDAERAAQVTAHLQTCDDCRRAAEAEAGLSEALGRLPRHAAPDALKRRLLSPAAKPAAPRRTRFVVPLASALAAAALVLIAVRVGQPGFLRAPGSSDLVDEAVNDHLRVVASSRPVEIESGGIHQVKPWFTGRVDFAPRVTFTGDDQFQLVGGSVGYFRDRKAAVFVWKVRLHTITLLVTRAEGLPWPAALTREARGFNVRLWRDGDLGYGLVSDVGTGDLDALAQRLQR